MQQKRLIALLSLLMLILSPLLSAQERPDHQSGTTLTAGVEFRIDEHARIDQSITPTIGLLHSLRPYLFMSSSLSYTPVTEFYGERIGSVSFIDFGFRLQSPFGRLSPYIGIFYDLRLYDWTNAYSPNKLNAGVGVRSGLSYRISRRFSGELYLHSVRNSVLSGGSEYSRTGRPDTQQNPDGYVRVGQEPYNIPSVYNPTSIGLSFAFRL